MVDGVDQTGATVGSRDSSIARRPKPSLKIGFGFQFIGNGLFAVGQWGIIVVLAKYGGAEFLGDFSLAQAIVLPVMEAGNANLRVIQATDVRRDYELPDYLGFRLCTMVCSFGLIVLICSLLNAHAMTKMFICIFAVSKGMESVVDTFTGWLQFHEEHWRIAVSRGMLGLMQMVCVVIALSIANTMAMVGYGLMLGSLIAAVVIAADVYAQIRKRRVVEHGLSVILPRWNWDCIVGIARQSLPMGIETGFGLLNVMVPRLVVEAFLGTAELGQFSALVYFNQISGLAFKASYYAALPRMAQCYVENIGEFKSLLLRLTGFAFVVGSTMVVLAALFGDTIVGFLFRVDFVSSRNVFVCVALAGLLMHVGNSVLAGLQAARQFRIQPVLTGVHLIVTTICCLLLVPQCGVIGAAIGAIVGTGSWLILSSLIMRRLLSQR